MKSFRHGLAIATVAAMSAFSGVAMARGNTAGTTIQPKAPVPEAEAEGKGLAVVYNDKLHGRKTASGARFDKNKLTTAHKTWPFGTRVELTNTKNGRKVVVVVTDRGPHEPDRMFDITSTAARALGISRLGQAEVTYRVLQ